MQDLIHGLTNDKLTALKAAEICAMRGFKPTGVVLQNEKGDRCIVELSAVRWLKKDEMWGLMHPDA